MSVSPFALPPAYGPSRGFRLFVYTWFWLPPLVLNIFLMPKYEPIFTKLEEKGELPTSMRNLVTAAHYDRLSYHVLSLYLLVELLALDETVLQLPRQFGRHPAWAWCWFWFVLLGGLCIIGFILYALLALVSATTCHLPG